MISFKDEPLPFKIAYVALYATLVFTPITYLQTVRHPHCVEDLLHTVLSCAWTFHHAIASMPAFLIAIYFILLSAPLITIFAVHFKNWNSSWLSEMIEEELRKIKRTRDASGSEKASVGVFRSIKRASYSIVRACIYYRKVHLNNDLKNFYLPSKSSFVILGLFLISLVLLLGQAKGLLDLIYVVHAAAVSTTSVPGGNTDQVIQENTEHIAKVFEALDLVIIALIVFVAESMRDDKDRDNKRILLKISNLWPLALTVTVLPFVFLWGDVRVLVPLEIIAAIVGMLSLSSILSNFLSNDLHEENRLKFLQDRVQSIILESVRDRVGNNILLKKLGAGKDWSIELILSHRWMDGGPEKYIILDSARGGWLWDINFSEFADLANTLSFYGRTMGIPLGPQNEINPTATESGGALTETPKQEIKNKGKKIYLLKKFRDQLPPDSLFSVGSRALLALPKEFGQNKLLMSEVRARIPHIFQFSTTPPSSTAFRRELQATKDNLVAAIKSTSLGQIEELRKIYFLVTEQFLQVLFDHGGIYTAETADKERNNYFDRWDEVGWLQQDIRDLLVVAAETDNQDVMSAIALLPLGISTRALTVSDHLLFREFLSLSPFLYYLASSKPDSSPIKSYLNDRSWEFPKQLALYFLRPRLREDKSFVSNPISIDDYREFSRYILKVFLDLMKSAADRKDQNNFRIFFDEFTIVTKQLVPAVGHPSSKFLRDVKFPRMTSELEREAVKQEIADREGLEFTSSKIKKYEQEILFGISGWLLEQVLRDRATQEPYKEMLDKVAERLPRKLNELASVYDSARKDGAARLWGWDGWDSIFDGQVRSVDSTTRPNQLFCVHALRILAVTPTDEVANMTLNVSDDMAGLMRSDNPIGFMPIIDQMRNDKAAWVPPLTDEEYAQIQHLSEILVRTKEAADVAEIERVQSQPISTEKVENFRISVLSHFNRQRTVKKLLELHGIYFSRLNEASPRDIPSWGFNQLDEKRAFMYDNYSGWGSAYGDELGRNEDAIAFRKMVDGASEGGEVEAPTALAEIRKIIREKNYREAIILQCMTDVFEYAEIDGNELFTPKYVNDCPNVLGSNLPIFMGVMKIDTQNVPVFSIYSRIETIENQIVILEPKRFGRWEQFSPIDNDCDRHDLIEELLVRVIDLNADQARRREIMQEPMPTWLSQKDDPDGYLRERVIINVYEKFKFVIDDATAATRLKVRTDDDENGETPPVGRTAYD